MYLCKYNVKFLNHNLWFLNTLLEQVEMYDNDNDTALDHFRRNGGDINSVGYKKLHDAYQIHKE